ncbi:hypothetical protein BDC45DRAFT_558270 [Circinella umbellata]|nr:hypothetical protein BDC45DRAFT_558270 [Circinella umbellata]
MLQPAPLHHNHPDISSSSSEIINKFQLEHYYNMDLINYNMDLPTDISVEASTSRKGKTPTKMTGLSSEDGNSEGSFYTNSNNNKTGTFSSTHLLNNSQATLSTTTANAKGCISSCGSKYLEDFLTYQAFDKPTRSDGLETKKMVQQSSPQTMKNSPSIFQGYDNIDPFLYETNDHGVSLQQQQEQEEYNEPISNTSCSPIPINRQEAQYNNMNYQQQESSFWSMFYNYNLNQTPCLSSTLSYSLSSIMDGCDMLNFDQQVEMSTPTTKTTTTTMTSPAIVKDSTNGFEESPMMLDFQKTATSGTSSNNNDINNTAVPPSFSSYINMLHRDNNSFSSFDSSLTPDTPSTHVTLPNYSVIPQEDISLSSPRKSDMITTTLKEKEKPNYYNQPMTPLSSCYTSTSTTNTSLTFHAQSNNNNNNISLSQYTNNKPIKIAPYSPSLSERNGNQSNQRFIKHQHQMTESDTTTTTTTTRRTTVAVKKRKYSESPPCGNCGKKFTRGIDLTRHKKTVHNHLKKYKCHECGRPFSRHDSLLRHERNIKDCRPSC